MVIRRLTITCLLKLIDSNVTQLCRNGSSVTENGAQGMGYY